MCLHCFEMLFLKTYVFLCALYESQSAVIVIVIVSMILGSHIQKDAIFFLSFVDGEFHLPVWTQISPLQGITWHLITHLLITVSFMLMVPIIEAYIQFIFQKQAAVSINIWHVLVQHYQCDFFGFLIQCVCYITQNYFSRSS